MATGDPERNPTDDDSIDRSIPSEEATHRRRTRYAGTHPQSFADRYKERDDAASQEFIAHIRSQGRTPAGRHVPVLLRESLNALALVPGNRAADCTLGYGGHAFAILQAIRPGGCFLGLDVDGVALFSTEQRLRQHFAHRSDDAIQQPTMIFERTHFAGLSQVMAAANLGACNGILVDLGASSMQIDDPSRGFSYQHDGPLDMRMDDRKRVTAAELLATMSQQALADAFFELSDEPDAQRIAELIIRRRITKPLETTRELTELLFHAKGKTPRQWKQFVRSGGRDVHPAARGFQTLRMLVNEERSGLIRFLQTAPYCLIPGGVLVVITFHPGEERIVSQALRQGLQTGIYSDAPEAPIKPSISEVASNPRAGSGRLWRAVRSVALHV